MTDKSKPTSGLLQFYVGDQPHTLRLTDSMLRDALTALAPYQRKTARGSMRDKSRILGKHESLMVYELRRDGLTCQQLAVKFKCSIAAIKSACCRVENGRYGMVPE